MGSGKEPIPKFASRIKAKYPEYKDVDDTLLVNKIVEKYPEYKEQVDFGATVKKKSFSWRRWWPIRWVGFNRQRKID